MRERLREYSNILQLDTETYLHFKYAPNGLVRALQMYFIVTLVAGLGIWLGIPVQIERPVLYEVLDDAQGIITDLSQAVEPYLEQNIPYLSAPEMVAVPVGDAATAAGEVINELLLMAETEAELVNPPLGPRLSRVIRLFGRWLSVPLAIMSDWIFLVLVAMRVAKLCSGRATLGQHLTAVLLSAAPLVLILPSFIPDMSPVIPVTFAFGITLFSRILALVGFGWAALILIKGLAVAHEFSYWRSLGILLLSWAAIYVVIPLITVLLGGYLIRF